MTVKQLIDLLSTVDPDREVLLSTDAEGNSFRAVSYVEHENAAGTCDARNDWSVGLSELTPALREMGFTDADLFPTDSPKVVVLFPQ